MVCGFGRFIRADETSKNLTDLRAYRCKIAVDDVREIPQRLDIVMGDESLEIFIHLESSEHIQGAGGDHQHPPPPNEADDAPRGLNPRANPAGGGGAAVEGEGSNVNGADAIVTDLDRGSVTSDAGPRGGLMGLVGPPRSAGEDCLVAARGGKVVGVPTHLSGQSGGVRRPTGLRKMAEGRGGGGVEKGGYRAPRASRRSDVRLGARGGVDGGPARERGAPDEVGRQRACVTRGKPPRWRWVPAASRCSSVGGASREGEKGRGVSPPLDLSPKKEGPELARGSGMEMVLHGRGSGIGGVLQSRAGFEVGGHCGLMEAWGDGKGCWGLEEVKGAFKVAFIGTPLFAVGAWGPWGVFGGCWWLTGAAAGASGVGAVVSRVSEGLEVVWSGRFDSVDGHGGSRLCGGPELGLAAEVGSGGGPIGEIEEEVGGKLVYDAGDVDLLIGGQRLIRTQGRLGAGRHGGRRRPDRALAWRTRTSSAWWTRLLPGRPDASIAGTSEVVRAPTRAVRRSGAPLASAG